MNAARGDTTVKRSPAIALGAKFPSDCRVATAWLSAEVELATGAPLTQVFVRLHVEPHGEQRELAAGDQEQRHEDDRCRRDRVPEDPEPGRGDPEGDGCDERCYPEEVEEHERVE